MKLEEILSLIESNNVSKAVDLLAVHCLVKGLTDAVKQYDPKEHDIHDKMKRKDKFVKSETATTNVRQSEQQKAATVRTIPVARLSLPEQKRIVMMAAAFLGNPSLSSNPSEGAEKNVDQVVRAIFEDNKLQYKFKSIAKATMSELQCAELWYTVAAEDGFWDELPMKSKYKFRMRIISPSRGDTLYPVYDEYEDMIAFGREYQTIGVSVTGASETTKHFDLYTADRFYYMKKVGGADWEHMYDPTDYPGENGEIIKKKGIANILKKIPVIYYSQPATEWADVQEMIDRLEKKISNHADTNDYFDSPIVKAKGKVAGFSDKGDSGKILQMDADADVSYLTWDNLPASMKMETENLVKFINTYSHTPDISLDNLKSIGALSGIALKTFFMDAHLKAADKEEIFGMGVQRSINYLKSSIAILDPSLKAGKRVSISPVFKYFLPKDVDGEVNTIVKAFQAGIISLESAVKLNPLVEDFENEITIIKETLQKPVQED